MCKLMPLTVDSIEEHAEDIVLCALLMELDAVAAIACEADPVAASAPLVTSALDWTDEIACVASLQDAMAALASDALADNDCKSGTRFGGTEDASQYDCIAPAIAA